MSEQKDNYLMPMPQAANHLYVNTDISSLVPRFYAMLTMDINKDILTQALRETLIRHPQFAVGVDKREDRYYYKKIEKEAEVYDEDGIPMTLGTEETNGYLIRVSYQGRYVYMDFHHSLGDGLSFIRVMNTMLYRYFELLGLPIENDGSVVTTHTSYQPEESANPYAGIEEQKNPYGGEPEVSYRAFQPQGFGAETTKPNTVVQIRMPYMALRGTAKQYEASPVTFISPLFSHAIYEAYEDQMQENVPIVTGIPINLRPHKPHPSTQYYITVGKMVYGKQIVENMDSEELIKKGKQLLDVQTNPDFLFYQAKVAEEGAKELLRSPMDAAALRDAYVLGTKQALGDTTYILTNMGNIKLPPLMQQYIVEYYPILPTAINLYTLAVTGYKGEMILSVAQRDEDTSICERFVELMNQAEIPAYVARVFQLRTTKYKG